MSFQKFTEWLQAKESTAFTRARAQAAKGLGPDIPDAEINSHDTAPPAQQELFKKKHKKEEKKGEDKGKGEVMFGGKKGSAPKSAPTPSKKK